MANEVQVKSKVSICQTCGSENNQVLLHRCIKCHISAQHRYCFRENPNKIYENFPYICPQCVVVPVNQTSPKRTYEFRPCSSRLRKHQRVEQPAGELVDQQPFLETQVSRPPETVLKIEESEDVQTSVCDSQLEDVLSENVRSLIEKDCEKTKDQVPATPEVMSCAQPIFEPSWKGTFEISGAKFDHLQAHVSANACLKVVETAKLMPAIVSTKMVPRVEIWPKSFRESESIVENIGLYIIPTSENGVKAFDQIVGQIMELDCALKVLLDNAELLLFSSTQLPEQYWRFSGKFYLWGVFRARKDTSSASRCVTESVRTSPVSPLRIPSSCSSDVPREKEDALPTGSNVPQAQKNSKQDEYCSSDSPIAQKDDKKLQKVNYEDLPICGNFKPFQQIENLVIRGHMNDSPESMKVNHLNSLRADAHSSDMSISASEKSGDIPSDDIVVNSVVYNKGVCHKCWKKRRRERTIANLIKKAKMEGLCFKCCRAGHTASACTTISRIDCVICGEITTTNEDTAQVKEIVSTVIDNQPLKSTEKDGKSTETIGKNCPELQEQGGNNIKVNIAMRRDGGKPNENEVKEKWCYFCGAPGHLRTQCQKFVSAVREMANCSFEDARSFCRDYETVSIVGNNTAGVGGLLPVSNVGNSSGGGGFLPVTKVYHSFTWEGPCHPANINAGGVGESHLPPNIWNHSQGVGSGPYIPANNVCNNFGGVGGVAYHPAQDVRNNFGGVRGVGYHPAQDVCNNFGGVGGVGYHPAQDVCNNFGGVGGVAYHPRHDVCNNFGGVGGLAYHPVHDACKNFGVVGGRPYLPANNVFQSFGGIGGPYNDANNICNNARWAGGQPLFPVNNTSFPW